MDVTCLLSLLLSLFYLVLADTWSSILGCISGNTNTDVRTTLGGSRAEAALAAPPLHPSLKYIEIIGEGPERVKERDVWKLQSRSEI